MHSLNWQNLSQFDQAPLGYDSVFGQPGDDLNYDEYVGESPVHRIKICPRWLRGRFPLVYKVWR